jgi:8-oxo-dGTP diphosphatase
MQRSSCHIIDLKYVNDAAYRRRNVGCLILTKNNKILLQQRDEDCQNFPGYLATFGGAIEINEQPLDALVRELHEELGAKVNAKDVVILGAVTEPETKHSVLVYSYFWHDKNGTITGCYEGKPSYFNDPVTPLRHPKVMNDVCWMIGECQKLELIKP